MKAYKANPSAFKGNVADISAFIRVAVVVNWMSADGTKVWATAPKLGTDYSIEFESGWVQGNDEYWYYTKSVAPTLLTDPLIKKAEQITKAPDGYFLSIEIVASAIQSSPDTTVETQWKNNKVDIEADNGTLTVINK
jgi:hypothetical protein